MYILGIETSCDETGAAVIQAADSTSPVTLLSNSIATSLALHAKTGGIIPEIAAREQLKYIQQVIDEALEKADKKIEEIDAIAVTYGPGLIGSLLVGIETAKTLSYLYKKPLIPVNHLYGHIFANFICENSKSEFLNSKIDKVFPAIALVVSGGHTDLVLMKDHQNLDVIGGTRDDAAGEAFDKIGRLLGLPYPAGPIISRLAENGNPKAFVLPRPMIGSGDFDFSFSGLKTAVLNLTKTNEHIHSVMLKQKAEEAQQKRSFANTHSITAGTQDDKIIADLCASVEEAIVDILVRKTLKAAQEYSVQTMLLGGGVAANTRLQTALRRRAKDLGLMTEISIPSKFLCTDNAAMIAAAGFYNQNITPWHEVTADPELYF